MSQVKEVDVIVDATGNPEAGAQIAITGINNKKTCSYFKCRS